MEECYAYYDAENRIIRCIKTRFPNRVLSLLKLATSGEVAMKKMDFVDGEDCSIKCPHHMDRVRTDFIINDYDEKKFRTAINEGFNKMKNLAMSKNFEAIRGV